MRNRRHRPSAPRGLRPGQQAAAVDRGPGRAPDTTHPGQAMGCAVAVRHDLARGLDLLWAKGQPLSRAATLASSSSRSSSISPSRALSRALLNLSPPVGRVAGKASPQPFRVAAVTVNAREPCLQERDPGPLPGDRPAWLLSEPVPVVTANINIASGKNAIAELAGA